MRTHGPVSSAVVLLLALGASAPAAAQQADVVDWSLPDPFEEPRPTTGSTRERVVAPEEQAALSRPLVLRSVVVYGTSRRAFEVPPLRSPSIRPVEPLRPAAPSSPRVDERERARAPRRAEGEPEAPPPRRERVAALDPAIRSRSTEPSSRRERPATTVEPSSPRAAIVEPRATALPVLPARRPVVDAPDDPPDVVALRGLSADACFERLRATGTPFERLDPTEHDGVEQPAIVRGPLGGVLFRPYGTASGTRMHQIVDCRLALAMRRAAPVFRAHGIREVRYLSIFRPGARVRSGSRAGRPSLHSHALAIDVPSFVRDDGTTLNVERDWGPAPRGAPVCGPDAVVGTTDASAALRALACDLHARRAFQMILTPQYDQAHHDHFHIQLDPHETRLSVR
ncbi:MAG: extensin family protein [Deltaproteobacteria bacterium]|nr:extensin family protein [Deltaproteobacteria bacterium]